MTLMIFALLATGLALLTGGAEVLVRGASRLAIAAGISPLVVGLTVVAYATSSPEMAVSVKAALAGQPDLALGNVLGSNIFNVLFILGISALIIPLVVHRQLVRREVPIMIGAAVACWGFAADGRIARLEGLALTAGAIGYTIWTVQASRARTSQAEPRARRPDMHLKDWALNLLMVAGGLGLLVLGARLFVTAAVDLARAFGLSDLAIGMTIVAAGTSLPEVATSIIAAVRGERDIAVGNVVGSNIFNILAVLGFAAALSSSGMAVPAPALALDIPVMVAVSLVCLPIFFTDFTISRWEGGLLLALYLGYASYLLLAAQHHSAGAILGGVMLVFVLPITVLALVTTSIAALGRQRSAAQDQPPKGGITG